MVTEKQEAKEVLTATFEMPQWGGRPYRVENLQLDKYINPGDWWGKVWVIGIGQGYNPAFVAVEADNEQDALDTLIDDGSYNHLFCIEDENEPEESWHSFGGNFGIRYDSETIACISRATIHEWYSVYPRQDKYSYG